MKRRVLYAVATLLVVVAVAFVLDEYKGAIIASFEVRTTSVVATERPDQVSITWSDDPRTTQTVEWRTAPAVTDGWVQYREKGNDATAPSDVKADSVVLKDRLLKNDPVNERYTAVLRGLNPGTTYTYRVGSKQRDIWGDWAEFTTEPGAMEEFSFIYMGDPQVGLDSWGKLLHSAQERHPETAFYLLAGDIVSNGTYRNLWDEYFRAGAGVLERRPVMAALGNHDYSSRWDPRMFLQFFPVPANGPKDFPAGHAYSFRYDNALFVVLDSNQDAKDQAAWIEDQLAHTDATWKFAMFHHPMYSSKGHRDNEEIRTYWEPLFDKYHVDMALQGHDHAYLRTYPMRNNQRVATPKDGTYYIVSNSGSKFYEQEPHDYAEVGFVNTSTYQVIDIATNPDRLTYHAYDAQGNVKDELTITK